MTVQRPTIPVTLALSSFILILFAPHLTNAQAPRPNGRGSAALRPIPPQSPRSIQRNRTNCVPVSDFRTLDGTCTNPVNKQWGSTGRAHNALTITQSSVNPTGTDRPSARLISNIVCTQDEDIFNSRGLNELTTFIGQFLDHTFVSTPSGGKRMDIDIPSDDPVFANFSGKLHFTRSERTPVEFFGQQDGAERPTNSLTSVLDLSSVYGVDKMRADELRSMQGGKLKTSAGNLLPFNKNRFQNNPSSSPSFFIAGDFRSNEHPMLASIHTLFMREHNHICDELAEKFPSYDDEMLYQTARKINGAQFQKIVLDEFYPAIVGKSLPRYTGFKQRTDPTMQDVFTTAAFRIGHTMVGNVVSRRGPGGSPLPSLAMKDTFFRMTDVLNGGIEDFIRGALKVRAQEIDVKVHSTLRNFLFTGIQEEEGFDLVSLNLQRGRDHAIPSYTDIRIRLIRRGVRGVADITKNANRQSRLLTAYDGNVRDMDAWIGLMAEDHVRGGSMGPTMVALWERQFRALRDGDRFYYKNRGVFSRELRSAIPRLERLFSGSGSVLKEVLLRNTNIAAGDIPNKVFFV